MSNKDFETKVLSALDNLQTDVSWLKEDVSWLKTDVSWLKTDVSWLKEDVSWLKGDIIRLDNKIDKLDSKMDSGFDRLEWVINDQTEELKGHINLQWAYINQAFDIITTIQNDKANNSFHKI